MSPADIETLDRLYRKGFTLSIVEDWPAILREMRAMRQVMAFVLAESKKVHLGPQSLQATAQRSGYSQAMHAVLGKLGEELR
jgi:hypothetical protein